jgi:hypothetical protein
MEHTFFEYLSVLLISTIKVGLGGIPLSFALGFNTQTIIVLNIIGGSIGAFVFVNLSDWLNHKMNSYFSKKAPRKKFTRTNRIIIKVKKYGGVYGLCFITPLFLSFPLGCFVTVRYFRNKKQIILWMIVAVVFWSIILGSFGALR